MSLEVVSYNEAYLDNFSYCGEERRFFSSDEEVREIIRKRAQKEGKTLIGLFQGEVIFFEGIYLVSSQVGEAWIFLNPPLPNLMLPICRSILKTMHFTAEKMNLVRLQSLCLPLEKTRKFLGFLGFKQEAVLHSYYHGRLDALVYTILWRERCQP